jgi:hypothetical protein
LRILVFGPAVRIAALVSALGACSFAVLAADAFYLGGWRIVSAVVAPWADPNQKPDSTEMKSLVGKVIAVKQNEISGPAAMTCKGPNYRVKDTPASVLFQGAFEEMQRRDKSADPVKIAAKLGFRGSSWKTLETGCANELELHFVDLGTAEFGLNDFVYTLKKQ